MDRYTHEQDIVALIINNIREEQEKANICYKLMYDNPGKYTRLYKQPVPLGFESVVKDLKKEQDQHKKTVKKLWSLIDQDKYGTPYYLITSPFL